MEYSQNQVYNPQEIYDVKNSVQYNYNYIKYLEDNLNKQIELNKKLEERIKYNEDMCNSFVDIFIPGKFNGIFIFDIIKKFPYLKYIDWKNQNCEFKTQICSYGSVCKFFNSKQYKDDCIFSHTQEELDFFRSILSKYNSDINFNPNKIIKKNNSIKKIIKKNNTENNTEKINPNFIPLPPIGDDD